MEQEEKQRQNNPPKKLGGATGKGFMPGQCGNPKGHPKGQPNLRARINRMFEIVGKTKASPALTAQALNSFPDLPADVRKNMKTEEVLAAREWYLALKGDTAARDRLLGKAEQKIDMNINPADIQMALDNFSNGDKTEPTPDNGRSDGN